MLLFLVVIIVPATAFDALLLRVAAVRAKQKVRSVIVLLWIRRVIVRLVVGATLCTGTRTLLLLLLLLVLVVGRFGR